MERYQWVGEQVIARVAIFFNTQMTSTSRMSRSFVLPWELVSGLGFTTFTNASPRDEYFQDTISPKGKSMDGKDLAASFFSSRSKPDCASL
jgi:hypothetical protein